jgi:acetylornithine/N-succinyldiaminopimelate aminotransferase
MESTEQLIEREHNVLYQSYKRLPISVASAEGSRIYTLEGTVYLDMLAGIAVNALGHSHPRIITAITEQVNKYMHVSNFFYQEPQIRLAELLIEQSKLSKVLFSNSGAEAWEGAIKLARKWGNTNGKTGNIIGFTGGFHGRTYAALSTMDKPLYKDGMEPFLPNTLVLPYNDVDALLNNVDETTCAIGLEYIQGEGGITSASAEFVSAIEHLRNKYGVLLIADEVQSGVGRTGDFFAYQHHEITPDIITFAKGIGGGLPLGGLIANEMLSTVWEKGQHGTTYGGNALACVAGIVVVEEVLAGVMDNAREKGRLLIEELRALRRHFPNYVLEVRGRGLMVGLVVHDDATILRDALLEERIITNATAGNVLRLVPPLTIDGYDIEEFVSVLRKTIERITRG